MRRQVLNLLLATLFLLAQQAALVHQIGHGVGGRSVAAAQTAPGQGSDPADRGTACDKCFQFAHVTSAAPETAFSAGLLAASQETADSNPAAELTADAPQVRSRGPPSVL